MVGMIEPTTVWAVRIGLSNEDARGRLSIEGEHLVFELHEEAGTLRLPLKGIRKARRLRGSPVLVVECEEEAGPARFAFFFTKPPPMPGKKAGTSREPRHRTRRRTITYLQTSNADRKGLVKDWERAVREAVAGSRD